MSDASTRTSTQLPPRVSKGERPKASTINGILDALGPRALRINGVPYRESWVGASSWMYNSYTVSGPTATPTKVTFSDGYDSNVLVIAEDHATDEDITVQKAGIYSVSLCAVIALSVTSGSGPVWGQVHVGKNGSTQVGNALCNSIIGAPDEASTVKSGVTFDVLLSADDALSAWHTGAATYGTATITDVRLTVRLVHLT